MRSGGCHPAECASGGAGRRARYPGRRQHDRRRRSGVRVGACRGTGRGVGVGLLQRRGLRGRGGRGMLCWYLVTYHCSRGVCRVIDEELLWCDPCGGGGGECDDDAQNEIYGEYDSSQPHGGHGQLPQELPADCETIEHHSSGHQMAANFTWGELNGGFQDGNPHRGNGGGWGWVQSQLPSGLQALRGDWAADSLGTVYGAALPVSSGYRCPHGNASIPGASNRSWHMSGVAADIRREQDRPAPSRLGHPRRRPEGRQAERSVDNAGRTDGRRHEHGQGDALELLQRPPFSHRVLEKGSVLDEG